MPGTAAATQTYLDAVAQANRDFAVNQANGVSTAAAQQTAALNAAAAAYQTAAAANDGRLQTDLASANLAYVNATESPLPLGEGQGEGVDLAYASSTAALQCTYTVAVSNAYTALQTVLVGWVESDDDPPTLGLAPAYAEQSADSYRAAVHAFALANPSPWAALADAKATAADTEADSDAEFDAAWSQADIDAQQIFKSLSRPWPTRGWPTPGPWPRPCGPAARRLPLRWRPRSLPRPTILPPPRPISGRLAG